MGWVRVSINLVLDSFCPMHKPTENAGTCQNILRASIGGKFPPRQRNIDMFHSGASSPENLLYSFPSIGIKVQELKRRHAAA